jgi:2-oxoglutarate dehydrogenase E1 component
MQESVMQRMWDSAHLSGGNAAYVEELYELYLHDPNAVPEEWRTYFQKLPSGGSASADVSHSTIRDHFVLLGKNQRRAQPVSAGSVSSEHEKKQIEVLRLIQAYRVRGHQAAQLDPLGLQQRTVPADLAINNYGLTDADLDTVFRTADLAMVNGQGTLREILQALQETYCRTIGAEYMHIVDSEQRSWFVQRLESVRGRPDFSPEIKGHLLERLTAAEGLEKYLGTKYPGTKRFGLEGGESLIPLLDEIIQRSGSYGTKEIVIGMAHRGRLNVLVNTFGKNPRDLFDEFEGKKVEGLSSGDVKYHQGFSSNVMTPGGEIHLAMAFNPSHLEIVSPVVEGSVRARQDRRCDPCLSYGGHHPYRGQQPGRLHHQQAGRCSFHRVRDRCGEDDPGADLPCERRRSRGGAVRHPARCRLPDAVQARHRHRPDLLPPSWSQRSGRAERYSAVDVSEDRQAAHHS